MPELPISVLCIPYAGAGAGVFRRWRKHPAGTVNFVPIQLPGREERLIEKPCITMSQVVAECAAQIPPLADNGDFALFGHSFGAIVAYETARYLVEHTSHRPAHLIVSGAAAPCVRRPELDLAGLPDGEFVTRLADLVGYDHEALRHPDLREILLPALRSDLAITDGYVARHASPLPVPIWAFRGTEDAVVTARETAQWASATSSGFRYIEIDGGHMYFTKDWLPLASWIDQITSTTPGHASGG